MTVSDRQKDLLSAVAEVFPSTGHRFCLRHIMNNINRLGCSLTVNERRLICSMARSDCESDLKFFTNEMKKKKADAVVYLESINLKRCVKYKFQEEFKIATYDEITSNLSEQANNWMGTELRSVKPLHVFHLYFLKLSEILSEKRQVAASMIIKRGITRLVDVLEDKLKELTEASKKCKFIPCMEGGYSVQYLGPVLPSGYEHPQRFADLPTQ
uniref:MULE transposase domain-containing protein n=1 Tax=Globisporangium ultimum (strain ATCC 200006 / CBS 805.95 / DAOM BR144) TaxID=431595 RepID=K3WPC3_GLOUD